MIIKSHYGALRMLSKAKGGNFDVIINTTPNMMKALKVLCNYILKGTLNLQDKHIKKLKPHRELIKKVADSNHKTIKATVQKGGSILQTILQTVLPLIPALL